MIWVSFASVLIAAISAVAAILARCDARKANADAKRSADAAEKSAQINSELLEAGKVRLTLRRDPDHKQKLLLTNEGTHTAYDVTVDAPAFELRRYQRNLPELHPGSTVPILAIIPGMLLDRRVLVEFSDAPDGPRKTVTHRV